MFSFGSPSLARATSAKRSRQSPCLTTKRAASNASASHRRVSCRYSTTIAMSPTPLSAERLASMLEAYSPAHATLLLDTRHPSQFARHHIISSINMITAPLMMRRLGQGKVPLSAALRLDANDSAPDLEQITAIVLIGAGDAANDQSVFDAVVAAVGGHVVCYYLQGGFPSFAAVDDASHLIKVSPKSNAFAAPSFAPPPKTVSTTSDSQPPKPFGDMPPISSGLQARRGRQGSRRLSLVGINPHLSLDTLPPASAPPVPTAARHGLCCSRFREGHPSAVESSLSDVWQGSIYIGCVHDATDRDLLTRTGITHVLSALEDCPEVPMSIEQLHLPISDTFSSEFEVLPSFLRGAQFIHEAVSAGGRVLVHCAAGVSRSPTMVAAYLILYHNMSMETSISHLQALRQVVSPNLAFLGVLLTMEQQRNDGRLSVDTTALTQHFDPTHLAPPRGSAVSSSPQSHNSSNSSLVLERCGSTAGSAPCSANQLAPPQFMFVEGH